MIKKISLAFILSMCFTAIPVQAQEDWETTGEEPSPGVFVCDEECYYNIQHLAAQTEYRDDYWKDIPYDWSVATLADGSYVVNPKYAEEWETYNDFDPVPEQFSSAPVKNITVGNYNANLVEGSSQSIVDANNQAAMFSWNGKVVIADHAHQGFKAIINNNTANVCEKEYTKVSQYYGINNGDIYLNDGRYYVDVQDGSLIMYTCIGSGDDVIVTYWNPTGNSIAAPAEINANIPKTRNSSLPKSLLKHYAAKVEQLNKELDN